MGFPLKNNIVAALIAAGLGVTSIAVPANAADLPIVRKAPVVAPAPLWNPWMIRVRALAVIPDDSGHVDITSVSGGLPAALVGRIPGSDLNVGNSVVPELDISYFFTPNFAVELILGVTPHKIHGAGTLAGLEIGKTWLLPPTLTFQYHFTNFGAFKPYVGAGINYTVMFNQKAANAPAVTAALTPNAVQITSLDVHNAFGFALQAGFDYMINRNWGLNFDVKKLFLDPSYTATGIVNGAPALAVTLAGKAHLDPWLIGGGVAYKF